MKKILVLTLSLSLLTSCYEDYVSDYDYTSVYFSKQYNTRTILVGEMMEIEVGVCLGGVMSNEYDRPVNYVINDDLLLDDGVITGFESNTETYVTDPFTNGEVTEVKAMPQDWYTISDDSQFIIPAGDHLGTLTVTFDEEKFLDGNGLDTKLPFYALPLEITSAPSIDYLLTNKYFSVIAIVYENMLYGNYWHGGETTVTDAAGATVETITYISYVAQEDDKIWTLETIAPYQLQCDKLSDGDVEGGMTLTLNADNSITIGAIEGAAVQVEGDGASTYNAPALLQDRELVLKYKYESEGLTYSAIDTLYFRNRVRDGVTEWRDENEENYYL